jgi:nucleoside-diphosphate-sugar epimerase
MECLIAGCGYLGTALGAGLAARGHAVWGVRRDPSAAERLARSGIRPVLADLLGPGLAAKLPPADAVVAAQAPSRPADDYRSVYLDATSALLGALDRRRTRRFLFVSSTSVYGTQDGSWVDEATDPRPGSYPSAEMREKARILLEAEARVLASGVPAVVARLGGLYGPGRNAAERARAGAGVGRGEAYVNRIRLEDAVSALEALLERGRAGEVYLVVDDAPSRGGEFASWLEERLGRGPDGPDARRGHAPRGSNKRCSNRKMRALGWAPRYPSFREGYADLV